MKTPRRRLMLSDDTKWAEIQSIVASGNARNYFSLGDQLECRHSLYGNLIWDIIGFDCESLVDMTKMYSLTLQLHNNLANMQFDAPQALYYALSTLAAGTYYFTLLAGYDTAYGGGKSYYFTLTKPVPAGGQIMFPWTSGTQASTIKISTYASRLSTDAIETVSVTEGASGTILSTTNYSERIRYGSSAYLTSPLRQWLNSSAKAGGVWQPLTIYSRPPSWAETTPGFLNGLDSAFLSVLGQVYKDTAKNTVIDGGGSVSSMEKIFLLSRSEVYSGYENSVMEGAPYPFYSQNSSLTAPGVGADTNRIKYLGGAPRLWWLRTPYVSYTYNIRTVRNDGTVSGDGAYGSAGVAPACCIN